MHWPLARIGNTDVVMARPWMHWPLARIGNTDVASCAFGNSGAGAA